MTVIFRMNLLVPFSCSKVSWCLIKTLDRIEIILDKDNVDIDGENIGRFINSYLL